jgi:hypothetical protein
MALKEEPGIERLKLGLVFQSDYRIPPFQREYTWTRENVETLIDDLKAFNSTERFYFLGQIVVTKPDPADSNRTKVVDGQQRLLTLQLLFIYLLKRLDASDIPNIGNVTEGLRIAVRKALDDGGFELRVRLSPEGEDVFRRLIQGQDLPRASTAQTVTQKNLINAYSEIEDLLKDEDIQFIRNFQVGLRERALLSRLTIGNLGEALDVFEKINHRGVKLGDTDLLKNHLFRNLADSEFENVSRVWENVSKKVFKLKPRRMASINLFFRAELTARTGKKIPSDGLLDEWESHLNDSQTTSVMDLVRELEPLCQTYCNFAQLKHSESEKFEAGSGLSEFRSVQHLPVLLAARHMTTESREFLVEVIEQRVLLSLYSGEGPQNLEKIIPEWSKSIYDLTWRQRNPSKEEILAASSKAMENLMSLWSSFRNRFGQLHYQKDKRKIRFALARIGGELELCRNPNFDFRDLIRNDISIDHIEPQTSERFTDESFLEEEFQVDISHADAAEKLRGYKAKADSWLHSIGNLALVRGPENSSMRNLAPPAKVPYYKSEWIVNMILCPRDALAIPVERHRQAIFRVQETTGLSLLKWGPRAIEKRIDFLAETFAKTFSHLEPHLFNQS